MYSNSHEVGIRGPSTHSPFPLVPSQLLIHFEFKLWDIFIPFPPSCLQYKPRAPILWMKIVDLKIPTLYKTKFNQDLPT
jgi:hypothetical protein